MNPDRRRPRARIFALLVLMAAPAAASAAPGSLEGSAPAILSDLLPLWLDGFAAFHRSVRVNVPPPYGAPQKALSPRLKAFLTGHIDFAFVSRKLADSDAAQFKLSHDYSPLIIPVAGGSWKSFGFVDPVVAIVTLAERYGAESARDVPTGPRFRDAESRTVDRLASQGIRFPWPPRS